MAPNGSNFNNGIFKPKLIETAREIMMVKRKPELILDIELQSKTA